VTASEATAFSSETAYAPFIRWSEYTSADKKKPDVLRCKCAGTETQQSQHSTFVDILLCTNEKTKSFEPRRLPLKSNNAKQGKLLDLWTKAVTKGVLKEGTEFVIRTWKGKGKHPGFAPREYIVEILS
jgi:hypothetical protein